MPAIKLKKVTAEYLAEKEREEKSKEKPKKTLEDVAEQEHLEKKELKKDDEEKRHNFLDVEILSDKRKRAPPVVEQKLVEWLDSNLQKKEDVSLPLLTLYEYYSEVCQMQGEKVVDVPVFNRYIRDKFGKTFGFQENSPYRVLIKERKLKEKKPKVQGETLQIKIRDIITNVINDLGNPRKGLRFQNISRAIVQKYPAQRVDLYPNKLKSALERGVMYGYIERMRGVGMCGYYRVPGEPTKEDPDDVKDKKKKEKSDEEGKEEKKDGEEPKENGDAGEGGDTGESEEKSTDDEKKAEEKEEGTEEDKDNKETKPEKKRKKKHVKKKKKPEEKWARSASRHSDPERVEDVFPLAITYQSDPKEATGGKIKSYIAKYYHTDVSNDKLRRALDNGAEKGLWELMAGSSPTGRYHLLIETYNPGRSEKLEDQIAQALVACHEPKQASASLIKKYITQYHPKLNVENRPHLFKHALEKACAKGVLRQLSGIGASGTFQLAEKFFPSPAILAGDSSDEEEEDFEESDEEETHYVPRPTKRGRIAKRPVPKQASEPVKRAKPKARSGPVKKGQGRNAKSKVNYAKYYEVSSEGESDEETEEVVYKPKSTKSRSGVATPAKRAPPLEEVKSTSKSRGKSAPAKPAPAKKVSETQKRSATKSPALAIESDESDEEPVPAEYTPRASKSRGGSDQEKHIATPKSTSRSRSSAKRKLIEATDADDESDTETPPQKKQRGKPVRESKKPATQTPISSKKSKRRR